MIFVRRSAATIAACLAVLSVASSAGQEPATQIKSPSPLRISVELVQIDATVTDGNPRREECRP